jgi:tRNA-Thr(GGU) m(6)t(6)A37 methyltransferase TsaA
MESIQYTPIGVVHSPFREDAGMPIQSIVAEQVAGTVELEPAYAPGLQDIEAFSHLFLLCHLHRAPVESVANPSSRALLVTPFLDDQPHGVFATRSPRRPNPIGLSIVRLVRVEGCLLHVEGLDLIDGTPVLDIKPYVPRFDVRETEQIGWYATRLAQLDQIRADGRFRDGGIFMENRTSALSPRGVRQPGLPRSDPHLLIGGLVARPSLLTAVELAVLPRASFVEALQDTAPGAASSRRWSGPRLIDVLKLTEPLPAARYVRVGAGDYVVPFSWQQAEEAILADSLDEQPLTVAQGAPWRLTLPGKRRFMNIKGVDRLEVVAEPGENTAIALLRARNKARRAAKKPRTAG